MTDFTQDIAVNLPDVYTMVPAALPPSEVAVVVANAAALIETVSGVFLKAAERETPVSVRDAAWLRKAIVFQAVWMTEQPGVLSRQGVSSLSQDGLSLSAPDSLTFVLAPLAKRALNNCSWAKSGTVRVTSTDGVSSESFLVSDNHPWSPLGAL